MSVFVLTGGLVAALSRQSAASPQSQMRLITGETDITSALTFVAIQPCRVVDTRGNGFGGDYGSPNLSAGAPRTFVMTGTLTGVPVQCGIPTTAKALAMNVTAVATGGTGNIQLYPTGSPPAVGSTVNFRSGINTANAALIALGPSGDIDAVANFAATGLVIDLVGYFIERAASTGGVIGGSYDNQANGEFLQPWSTNHNNTESIAVITVPAGTASTLVFSLSAAPGASNTATITLRKNGADTALTCTISDPATSCSDTANSVTFTDGDLLTVRYNKTGGLGHIRFSFRYVSP
jgi:hypothetical protein